MSLVKKISADVNGGKECKKITPLQLKQLGYLITERELAIGKEPAQYYIYEVIDEDKPLKTISFCYLYSETDGVGIILPDTFERYVLKVKA